MLSEDREGVCDRDSLAVGILATTRSQKWYSHRICAGSRRFLLVYQVHRISTECCTQWIHYRESVRTGAAAGRAMGEAFPHMRCVTPIYIYVYIPPMTGRMTDAIGGNIFDYSVIPKRRSRLVHRPIVVPHPLEGPFLLQPPPALLSFLSLSHTHVCVFGCTSQH